MNSRSAGLPKGFVNWLVERQRILGASPYPLSGSLFMLGTVAVLRLLLRLKLDLTKEQHIFISSPSLKCLRLLL